MPHTSKKKRATPNKRRHLIDEDGWTRVTTTSDARSTAPFPPKLPMTEHSRIQNFKWGIDGKFVTIKSRLHAPPHPNQGVSVEKMIARYRSLESKWLESTSYAALKTTLSKEWVGQGIGAVSKCVMFGSGSFSATALGREDVSFYQLAAFQSAVELIGQVQGHVPSSYAQEPFYVESDIEFLATLGITTVEHPQGFDLVDGTCFAYSPCAERWVELQIMYNQPRLWLNVRLQDRWPLRDDGTAPKGHSINWMLNFRVPDPENPDWHAVYDEDLGPGDGEKRLQEEYLINHHLYGSFRRSHQSLLLPDLDASNYPFSDCAIHWPVEDEESPSSEFTKLTEEVSTLSIQEQSVT
ncbi:hypothetical protein LTR84_008429 [Exophiala bonariae]|uniref:SRR1-like domain-containing protein n=1 Tax=Exophiala bonariae TaxID=1690606 RepID=A0AAV9MXT7_9EURO|nr:hypothetical protein LTR84_008429 [Exophiala bonariae]